MHWQRARTAIRTTLVLIVITAIGFPTRLSAIAHVTFPHQAETRLVRDRCGSVVGSGLVGQYFSGAQWFHGRPSAGGYNATASGGSNLGLTTAIFAESLQTRAARFRVDNAFAAAAEVPVDAITASGSGLDPEISLSNALAQVARVASARGQSGQSELDAGTIEALIADRASQLIELAAQNFLTGAAGVAVGIAFIRARARDPMPTIGNFWADTIRGTVWILLPIAVIGGLFPVWQGVPMSIAPYVTVRTLNGDLQTIATGPVAALEFSKQLGTNGGGFFNANGAQPLENPTALTNFAELLEIAMPCMTASLCSVAPCHSSTCCLVRSVSVVWVRDL